MCEDIIGNDEIWLATRLTDLLSQARPKKTRDGFDTFLLRKSGQIGSGLDT